LLDDSGKTVVVEGKIVVEAADGGLLLLARDGRLWTAPPRKLVSRERTTRPFAFFTADELGRALVQELGPNFEILRTKHYVIATSTQSQYAESCGGMFERLLDVFLAYWKGRGLELSAPQWPLAAIVFPNESDFKAHAQRDAGPFGEGSNGYYSIRTNRMVLYDQTAGKKSKKRPGPAEMKRQTAAASFNAATVVHEATHQIAFNSGMHTRYADNPLWLTEGMAMYFENLDLDATPTAQSVGTVNRLRCDRFLEFSRKRRKRDSLTTLVEQPDRFMDAHKAADAYAEAWALTYFLIETHSTEYVNYLKRIGRKAPLIWDGPSDRLSEFNRAFGQDTKSLDIEFLRTMKSVSKRQLKGR
jgi:hypothetical protein